MALSPSISKKIINNHQLKSRVFKSPSFCNHCGEQIGVLTKGAECTTCKNRFHLFCTQNISTYCVPWISREEYNQSLSQSHDNLYRQPTENQLSMVGLASDSLDFDDITELVGSHEFSRKHFSKFTYCNVCSRFIYGINKQGFACNYCNLAVHPGCMNKAPLLPNCKPFFSNTNKMGHYWINGNVSVKKLCLVCAGKVNNSNVLTGKQCSWCRNVLHDKCYREFYKVERNCDFGQIKNLILPPQCIHLPNNLSFNISDIQTLRRNCQVRHPGGNSTPLLVFVNNRSGGQQGQQLIKKFKRFLHPFQIFDLANGGPQPGLEFFQSLNGNYKILICGGDGTAGWVLSKIDELNIFAPAPSAIIPLGTGNDLARILYWGGGYTGEKILPILDSVDKAHLVNLDRWKITITPEVGESSTYIMNNYFSIGVDAKIAMEFHELREKNPEKFKSRTGNKIKYANLGAVNVVTGCPNLQNNISLDIDNPPQHITINESIEALIILNVPSYAGGCNLWPANHKQSTGAIFRRSTETGLSRQSINDRKLEILGIKSSFHLGQCKVNTSKPIVITQCELIRIILTDESFIQVDGEPKKQSNCIIVIEYLNSKPMLSKRAEILNA
eukprot:TRINITY_DN951_c0_g1_i3.p1 TRINITY_DN951_c0_g1~~TRINITY_DN951_c0_g1_i3.p1  ORF type:complete len:613 (+),score=222.08 TRINITY_DN951_c0_g1_i3:51-1889(+)